MIEEFKQDVESGLSASDKSLPSKYFYDATGDELFRQIMAMPEYYVTDAEYEIFNEKTGELINALDIDPDTYFEMVELGAGDGTKTKRLLRELVRQDYDFSYHPVDISANILDHLETSLNDEIPEVDTRPLQSMYFDALAEMKQSPHRKVVLFLGSNIGNMDDETAARFLYELGSNFRHDDILLLGVDLKKPRDVVLPAYNDARGITARFNLNLLERINRELGANFSLDHFAHRPEYDEEEGIAFSYLVSLANQDVYIESLDRTFTFSEGEKIHTEISRKYDEQTLENIIAGTDFILANRITDTRQYFADYVLRRN